MKKYIWMAVISFGCLTLFGGADDASALENSVARAGDKTMDARQLDDFAASVRKELDENILAFWLKHSLDHTGGGFIGRMSNDNIVQKEAPKGLILHTRILWTFSAAYRFEKKPEYLQMAKRAYDYLMDRFWDKQYGGGFWVLDYQGRPTEPDKELYGQSFVVYSLCEYYQATGFEPALEKAKELFLLIEKSCHDGANGGYYETFGRDWSRAQKARLASGDKVEQKTMNTHLHLLEAYTGLYRVWKDPKAKARLTELIEVFRDHIIDPQTYHFKLFFDEKWHSTKDIVSYGHDIEGSWLLCEAAEVLGEEHLLQEVRPLAVKMAQAVYERGFDSDGGLFYEAEQGKITNASKQWWPQAETVVGFLNAYQVSRQDHFLKAAHRCWRFIEDHIVDREHGEWFWTAPMTGRPEPGALKVSEWKGPYHNGRACLETIRRLRQIRK